MKTKLVYVLTSTSDNNYCEQALISIFTARYYNRDADIVLIVDNLTNEIFVDKRAEILLYITEKVVIFFEEHVPIVERSRFLKTSMRKYIEGDFLYIDCDTIITRALDEIDNCPYDLAAVPDSHLPVAKFNTALFEKVRRNAFILGYDISAEGYYYSSGVILVKDTAVNLVFFEKWHLYWKDGIQKGVNIDQPSFAKANIELGHPVKRLEDTWNCVMYTHPLFDQDAKIMHFCSFGNMSYIFTNHFLDKVKREGVAEGDFIKSSILNPNLTYLPFDNAIYSYQFKDYILYIRNIKFSAKQIVDHFDGHFDDFIGNNRIEKKVRLLFQNGYYLIGASILAIYKFYKIRLKKNFVYVPNPCSVNNI